MKVADFTKNNNSAWVLNLIYCAKYYRKNTIKLERYNMKATGIVRRIDDLGRIVIPKEIRRSFRIKEGDPSLTTLKASEYFLSSLFKLGNRFGR